MAKNDAADGLLKDNPSEKPVRLKGTRTTKQLVLRLLVKVAVITLATIATLSLVLGVEVHYGNNMFPAVRDGDLLVSLRVQEPFINAAVLYHHDGKTCVGRVIALEGHTVDITKEGALLVNGIAPAEEVFYATFPAEDSGVTYPYTVGTGEVFVLNDFRSDINDSRAFGAISRDDVMGPLLLVIRRRGF